jgi:peptidoglycan/xylan/chitin deacetylase (PgdA/CDA1 family)
MRFLAETTRVVDAVINALLIGAGMIIYHAGMAELLIRLNRRGVRILMYHACEHIESDFVRGLSINTPPPSLAAQLDFLRKHYRIIPVDWLTRCAIPPRAVAITFDDGFRSVYENAMPLLSARAVPATCYLVTDRLDDPSPIWINELNWYLRRHRPAAMALIARRLGIPRRCSMPVFIRAIIDRYEPRLIAGLLEELRSESGPPEHSQRLHLSRGEIEEMAHRGFRFGNHTATHAVLSLLDDSACHEEISRARATLNGLPGAIDSLAYPFGRSTEVTSRIARDLGYSTLMDVEGDNDALNLDHIGRVNVRSDSPAVLFARMELVARLKPCIKRLGRGMLFRPGR